MDGTLTSERLDYDAIRNEIGLDDGPILEAVLAMSNAERQAAEEILHRHEEIAAMESELHHGCMELLQWLDERCIGRALITRNTRKSVETVLNRHGLQFNICITREDGKFKPDPAPLLLACEGLNVDPADAWMVGDWKFDVEAGNAAGARSVWLHHGRERPFPAKPWRAVRDLCELHDLLRMMR